MKILYIGGFELPDKNAAAQRVVANAKLLRDIGHEVVLLGVDKSFENSSVGTKYKEDFFGFPSYGISYPKSFFQWCLFVISSDSIIRFLQANKFDCVIAYNSPALALWRLWRWCRKRGIRVVSDCTEWYLPGGNPLRKFVKAADIDFRMKFVHPRLDGLIAISRYLYDWYKPRMKNVLLLPPLVDKVEEKWRKQEPGAKSDELSFVYAGSPGGTKDRLDWAMRIFAENFRKNKTRFRFSVLGVTEEQYLKIASIPSEIREYITFLGRVSHKEALRVVVEADYQIFFRERNLANMAGFPTKFVESISCGTPIISNDFSNIKDYTKNGENGILLDLNDAEAVRGVMDKVVSGKNPKIEVRDDVFDYRHYRNVMRNFFEAL